MALTVAQALQYGALGAEYQALTALQASLAAAVAANQQMASFEIRFSDNSHITFSIPLDAPTSASFMNTISTMVTSALSSISTALNNAP